MTPALRFGLAVLIAITAATSAAAATCTPGELARAVDQSGASLRDFSVKMQPELRARMRAYANATKMPAEEPEDAALDAIKDATLDDLDEKSAALLLKVDGLGRNGDAATVDCEKLDAIKTATGELLSVMKAKSDYMLARLDSKIAELTAAAPAPPKANALPPAKDAAAAPTPRTIAKADDMPKAARNAPNNAQEKPAPKDKSAAPAPGSAAASKWTPKTQTNDAYQAPADQEVATLPPVSVDSGAVLATSEDGFTVDEIREATRGFFGTVSTSLASVIEHAFKTSGRPTAYVLGSEGGGAFLAGLRFGQGTLYMRNQPGTRPVYWHGPSVGTDFGASGSRTMFLIYRLREPSALYRSFSGIDGSAYFVGGVGVTLLKGGEVIMAPIRSGLGLRVGASLGYVRFTDRPTWNPF